MARRRKPADNQPTALVNHLKELRNRFFLVATVLLLASSLVYAFRAQIIPIILRPYELAFGAEKLMYLNPAGGFSFIFFISIYLGLAITIPVLIHQLYAFIRPTLPPHKQSITGRLLISSSLLLVAGMLFGYFIAVPGALDFLKEFASDYVSAALTAESYLHFLAAYTVGLGLLFQIPLILVAVHYISPLTPTGLLKSERWVIVLVMIAAAIITPTPDPVNMLIVAIPIILIYQLGVIAVLVSIYKKRRSNRLASQTQARRAVKSAQIVRAAPPEPTPAQSLPASTPIANINPTPVRSVDGLIIPKPRTSSVPTAQKPRPTLNRAVPAPTPARSVQTHRYLDGVSPMYRSV